MLSRESFELSLRISAEYSFEKFGAPVLAVTDDIITTEDGFPAYGHHFEVVAYENAINVWELNGKDQPVKLGFLEFFVPAGMRFLLQAELTEKTLTASLLRRELVLSVPLMPSRLRAGFTACEGVNRFTRCVSTENSVKNRERWRILRFRLQ